MNGKGSCVSEIKGNRDGLIRECGEEEKGQGWMDGGVR